MSHNRTEVDVQCTACVGTGLYVGMAERDGWAVQCWRCKGTGKAHIVFEYDDFVARIPRPDIYRVLEVNPGICVGRDKNFGGQSYESWQSGQPFPPGSEMREFTCPQWWYQFADDHKCPKWDKCTFGSFSVCPYFPNKAECWRQWDTEHQ